MENNTKTIDLDNSQIYSADQIIKYFAVDPKIGLTSEQIAQSQALYGKNEIEQKKKNTILTIFLRQFKNLMIIILLIAAIVALVPLFIPSIKKEAADWAEPFVILLVSISNAIIGTIQEYKADQAVESLKQMTTNSTRVIRNHEIVSIPTSELCVGDIIFIESGDNVYADARILRCNNLHVVEAVLTGESVPSEKNHHKIWNINTPIGDRCNMLFSGTSVVSGTATAIVTSIGMQTQLGKIAKMIQDVEPSATPLQKQLTKFTKLVSFICLAICFVTLGVELLQIGITKSWSDTEGVINAIMIAVSLAVAAIPESLPLVITINMSLGMIKMAKENALVKNLASVEVLGSSSVICTDKTGTLTQNQMTINKIFDLQTNSLVDINNELTSHQKLMLTYGEMCCNASITYDKHKNKQVQGDPTELAIVQAYQSYCNDIQSIKRRKDIKVGEISFDSTRKLMSAIYKVDDKYLVITKGANESLIKCCRLTTSQLTIVAKTNLSLAADGNRTLAIGYKFIDSLPEKVNADSIENNLTYMGLFSMIDPPREAVKSSIVECKKAGIKIVMITGDHILTAKSIAENLGIYSKGDIAITGEELEKMDEKTFLKNIKNITVYARVSPKDKLRITDGWKKLGQVVAMIGDGVNDAPALKNANIGCAMGNSSDVSKDASDVILQDNDFQSIVQAIHQGRSIFANILKVINYLIATNFAEIIVILCLIFVGISLKWTNDVAFSSIQILWINLLGDSLPAISLGLEPPDENIMTLKPRNVKDSIFAHGMWIRIFGQSTMLALISLSSFFLCYFVAKNTSLDTIKAGSTGAFLTLGLGQMVQILNLKSDQSIFKTNFLDNKKLLYNALISTILILLVVFIPKVVDVFNMVLFFTSDGSQTLSLTYIYLFLIPIIVPIAYMEVQKILFNRAKIHF